MYVTALFKCGQHYTNIFVFVDFTIFQRVNSILFIVEVGLFKLDNVYRPLAPI